MRKFILIWMLLAAKVYAADVGLIGSGNVEFEASGRPSMLKIKGAGEGASALLRVAGNKISGEIIFKLRALKTGMELRDQHMLEKYLQVGAFPDARLFFKDFSMPGFWSLQSPLIPTSTFRGKLLLHGVEREITGSYSILDPALKTDASFDVKLSDFKIANPEYLGVKVTDIVHVTVHFEKMAVTK